MDLPRGREQEAQGKTEKSYRSLKPVVVQWDAAAYREFEALQRAAAEGERSAKPSYAQLLSSINRAIENLRADPFCGDLIPRQYLSKRIIAKYGTDKLFRLELVGYWRLLYTVVGDEAKIIALILEYMDHPTYDKCFGYKKK